MRSLNDSSRDAEDSTGQKPWRPKPPLEIRRQSSLDRISTEYDTASLLVPDSFYKKRQGDSREASGFNNDCRTPHERGMSSPYEHRRDDRSTSRSLKSDTHNSDKSRSALTAPFYSPDKRARVESPRNSSVDWIDNGLDSHNRLRNNDPLPSQSGDYYSYYDKCRPMDYGNNGTYFNGSGSDYRSSDIRPIYQPPPYKVDPWYSTYNSNYDRRFPPPPMNDRRFPPQVPANGVPYYDYSGRYDPNMIFNTGGSTIEAYNYYNGTYYDGKDLQRRNGPKDYWDNNNNGVYNNQLYTNYGVVESSYKEKDLYSDSVRFSKGRDAHTNDSRATDSKKGVVRGLGYQSPHRRASIDAIPPGSEYSHSLLANNASKFRQYSFGSKKSNQPSTNKSSKKSAAKQSKFRSAAIYGASFHAAKKDDTNCNNNTTTTTERDHSSSSSNNNNDDCDADCDNKSASTNTNNKLEGKVEASSSDPKNNNEMDDTEGSAIDASEQTAPEDSNLMKEEEEEEEEEEIDDNDEKFKFISDGSVRQMLTTSLSLIDLKLSLSLLRLNIKPDLTKRNANTELSNRIATALGLPLVKSAPPVTAPPPPPPPPPVAPSSLPPLSLPSEVPSLVVDLPHPPPPPPSLPPEAVVVFSPSHNKRPTPTAADEGGQSSAKQSKQKLVHDDHKKDTVVHEDLEVSMSRPAANANPTPVSSSTTSLSSCTATFTTSAPTPKPSPVVAAVVVPAPPLPPILAALSVSGASKAMMKQSIDSSSSSSSSSSSLLPPAVVPAPVIVPVTVPPPAIPTPVIVVSGHPIARPLPMSNRSLPLAAPAVGLEEVTKPPPPRGPPPPPPFPLAVHAARPSFPPPPPPAVMKPASMNGGVHLSSNGKPDPSHLRRPIGANMSAVIGGYKPPPPSNKRPTYH